MRVTQKNLLNNRTKTPVALTAMGFGAAPLGNLYTAMSDAQADETLDAALSAGFAYFDTAPFYGLGLSEQRVGKALSAHKDIVISTKVGRLLHDCHPDDATPEMYVDVPSRRITFDYSYDGIMRSYAASLNRLNGARPNILLLHDIDPGTHGQAVSDRHLRDLFEHGGYRALQELRENGDIAAIGAGVNDWKICERLLGEAEFDCFLLAGRYTLLEQEALDSFLPLCEKRDVGIILGGPYNSGILATGAVPGARYNYMPAEQPILDQVAKIEAVCASHNVPLIAAALQFVMGHPAVRSVIPGAANPTEIASNVAVFNTKIPADLWSDLQAEGLIRTDAPCPKE
ncbi:aldo/keto reductase [Loktanella sp. D2R18]|uniref:aldo/keto reductase n=1 Tax=Rhodobacterales TaxID=204455 RepID=UPI000DEAAD26|nr:MULTISPECIES: aldo/keto reductase [Rhodobacterales]MDO6590039.1 aldo/keto reductase [Yoonia sp. 1_MG-2023]RBW45827.1 aldo/keto reductase [Loktanella sp. D2R18]